MIYYWHKATGKPGPVIFTTMQLKRSCKAMLYNY